MNRRFELAAGLLIETAHAAVEYVKYHFGTEEKFTALTDYPNFSEHKKQQEEFIK